MKVEVKISSNILNWVFEEFKDSDIDVKYIELLEKWKNNDKVPSFNQIQEISRVTRIPFGYFFLDTPPKEDKSIIEFRTVKSISNDYMSRNLIDTVHYLNLVQNWMIDYIDDQKIEVLNYVGSGKAYDFYDLLNSVRNILELDIDWFKNCHNSKESFKYIRGKISSAGVIVMLNGVVETNNTRKLSVDEFRALCLIDKKAPIIFINSNDTDNAKLFSLVHEFTHVLLGVNSLLNTNFHNNDNVDPNETLCNKIASEIIVPRSLFIERWSNETCLDDYEKINKCAKYFKCSQVVIARKALEEGYIKKNVYVVVANKAADYVKKNGRGDFYKSLKNKLDKRFLECLSESVSAGKTPYTYAYRLTNTSKSTYNTLISDLGGAVY